MAGTSWPTLTAGAIARASDVNAHFAWLEGHIVPQSGGSTTDAVYDLGTTTANWRTIYTYSLGGTSTAKGIAVGTTTVVNHSDVAFEIAGIRAFLLPRMTTAQKNNLAGVNGMVVYDSTLNQHYKYENGAWKVMGANNIGIQPLADTTATFSNGAAYVGTNILTYTGGGRVRSLEFEWQGNANFAGTGAVNLVADGFTIGSFLQGTQTTNTVTAANIFVGTNLAIGMTNSTARFDLNFFFKSSFKVEVNIPNNWSGGGQNTVRLRLDWEHE